VSAAGGLVRPNGPAKLTGTARYAADNSVPDMLHAVLVTATVPHGRLSTVDTAQAAAAPGVVGVLTAADMPRFAAAPVPPLASSLLPMQDDLVAYEGQPIALVAAGTREQAEHAARLVRPRYTDLAPGVAFGAGEVVSAHGPNNVAGPDLVVGDPDAALADADVVVREIYRTADRHHNPIEPSATLAWWDGDQLSLHDAAQGISAVRLVLAAAFGLPADHVHVSSPFIGGGFGCKGYIHPHQLITAAGARVLGRPVKLVLSRAQMFTGCGHQPATRQTVTLAAGHDGALRAVEHHSVNAAARADDYTEFTTLVSDGSTPLRSCG